MKHTLSASTSSYFQVSLSSKAACTKLAYSTSQLMHKLMHMSWYPSYQWQ